MGESLNRRQWMVGAPVALGVGLSATGRAPAAEAKDEPFGYSLNTSTIRGQNLPLVEEIELAARAGYNGMEPWIRQLDEYVQGGGKLADLRKRFEHANLAVVNAIGFFDWAVDDDARRRKGLDEAKRNMDLVRQVGGSRLAAPPAGATDRSDIDPRRLAERYRALLELGRSMEVTPMVEVWGFSKALGRLDEAAQVAIASNHPDACILADVYHLYKGGSGFEGLRLLGPKAMHVLHMNDYPDNPPRESITDADRVYPGDGVAPLGSILRTLRDIGFRGMLSLELFNKAYYKQDAATVARTGLEKMRAAVRKALAEGG